MAVDLARPAPARTSRRRARCASTSARRPASARPSPCSTRAGAGGTAAPTWSSASSRPTAGPRPRSSSATCGRPAARPSSTAASAFEEMDLDAVLARRPEVALVDELAHTNVPGIRHAKRWQDIDELLDAGIDVISTRQHPAPRVAQRRRRAHHRGAPAGDRARRRGAGRRPDRAGRHDPRGPAPPHGPRQHLRARADRRRPGQLLPAGQPGGAPGAGPAVGGRPGRRRRSRSTASGTASPNRGRPASGWSWPSPARPAADRLIRRAARIAQRAHGRAAWASTSGPTRGCRAPTSGLERASAACWRRWAAATTRSRAATSPPRWSTSPGPRTPPSWCSAPAARSRCAELIRGSVINRVVRLSGPIDVHVISHAVDDTGDDPDAPGVPPVRRHPAALPPRRRLLGWLLAAVGLPR